MLSDAAIRSAAPSEKARKLTDGRGLYLLIQPSGGKLWRFDYRFDGKRRTLALGSYPDVSLAKVREKREEARQLIAQGIDPGAVKQAVKASRKAANSFEAVAREWHAKQAPAWVPSHAERIIRRLERDIFPWLGARPVAEITAPELLAVLRRIEGRGRSKRRIVPFRTAGRFSGMPSPQAGPSGTFPPTCGARCRQSRAGTSRL